MEAGACTYAASLSLTLLWGLCVLRCLLCPAEAPFQLHPIAGAPSPPAGPLALNDSASQRGALRQKPWGEGPLSPGPPSEGTSQSRPSSHRSVRGSAPVVVAGTASRRPARREPRGRALRAKGTSPKPRSRPRPRPRPQRKAAPKRKPTPAQTLLSSNGSQAGAPPALGTSRMPTPQGGQRAQGGQGGQAAPANDPFVRRSGRQLVHNGRAFYANGFNAYWLMYIASIPDQRYLVPKILGQAQGLGLTVCRTLAFYDGGGWHALQPSPGVFNEDTFQALDYVVDTAKQFGIRLHLVLTNNWSDYGGKPQCRAYYKQFVRAMILRRNTRSGVVYRDDPTIFGWDLINEPRINDDPSGDVLQSWITEMAAHVKSLDSNHLLSIGAEGFYGPSTPQRQSLNAESWMSRVGTDFVRNNQVPGIDIASIHAYANSRYSVSQWGNKLQYYQQYVQGHVDDCNGVLGMPLLLGEFGPDSVRGPDGSLDKRNQVYEATYSIMLASARAGGSGAVAMFWQLMPEELASWDDGIAVFVNSHPTTAAIIRDQSRALQ